MTLTPTELTPILAIAAGILILLIPRLLSYIIALYLIYSGFMQLNAAHHWVRFGLLTHLRPAIVRVHAAAKPKVLLPVRVGYRRAVGQDRVIEVWVTEDRVTEAPVTKAV